MPIPAEIETLLKASAAFNPSLTRQEYEKSKDTWQLYLDLMELDQQKLAELIEKHSNTEADAKYQLRQKLSCAFNLVPTLINMIKGYLFSQEPAIDVKKDPDLESFLADCNGAGLPYVDFVRQTILPMSAVMGFLDVLVQNPLIDGEIMSQQDARSAGAAPGVYTVTPLDRINWSSRPGGDYNWVCFAEISDENPNPLRRNVLPLTAYITVSAAFPQYNNLPTGLPSDHGFWVRSWQPFSTAGSGDPPEPQQVDPPDLIRVGAYVNLAGWTPTARVPIASLYWQRSNDPKRRHFGVSKIAMIAVLVKQIIQVLSWTTEDVLANLAIMALPTTAGRPPKDENGNIIAVGDLSAFSYICFPAEGKHAPLILQGAVDHIRVKMELIDSYVTEILRLAHLMFGATAKAEKVTSGVQAVVQRNELFQELKDAAGALDSFTLDVLALVKSWATGKDWSREQLLKEVGPTVSFYKGPYTADSFADVLRDGLAAIEAFRQISPTLVESALKQIARAYLYSDDPDVPQVMTEIERGTAKLLADQSLDALLGQTAAMEAGTFRTTLTETEAVPGGAGPSPAPQPAGAVQQVKPVNPQNAAA